MSQPRRGIRVTLITALLTALVATVAAPSVFAAVGTITPVSNLAGTTVGASVPAAAGPVVTFTVVTPIVAPTSTLVNAVDIAFPTGTVLPTTGWTFNGYAATAFVSGSNVQIQWPSAFDTVPVYIGVGAGAITNPPADGLVTVSTWGNATVGTLGTGTEYDAGSVDMGLVAASACPTGTVYGAGGYLSACPSHLAADGVSLSTVTVNTAALGSTAGTLTLTTTVGTGTFTGTVTATAGAGAWISPSVAPTIVSGTKANGTSTVSLRAPTTAGASVLQLYFTPTGGSQQLLDTVTVTFTKLSSGQGNTEREHAKGARKVAFYASTGATMCAAAPVAPSAGTRSFGFAILNTTGHGRVNVEVSLKGAAPNSTYSVYLDQAGTCSPVFTLRTNSRGNGNRHLNLAMVSGATQAWLTAIQATGAAVTNGSNVLVTNLAMVSVKGHGHEDAQGNHGNQDNPGRGHGKG